MYDAQQQEAIIFFLVVVVFKSITHYQTNESNSLYSMSVWECLKNESNEQMNDRTFVRWLWKYWEYTQNIVYHFNGWKICWNHFFWLLLLLLLLGCASRQFHWFSIIEFFSIPHSIYIKVYKSIQKPRK